MGKDTDFIEVGRGNQSKVIGHNNTISELGATALSIVVFSGKAGFVVFAIMAVWLYVAGYTFYWAVAIALSLSIPLTVTGIYGLVQLTLHLHNIIEPRQVRDDRGRFVEMRPINSMGKTRKTLKSVDKDSYEVIERWGGGG